MTLDFLRKEHNSRTALATVLFTLLAFLASCTTPEDWTPPPQRPVGYRQLPGEFCEFTEMQEGASAEPGMVTTILGPTLGCPARMGAGRTVEVFLAGKPNPAWKFYLVERSKTDFLDTSPFVHRPLPDDEAKKFLEGVDLFSRRVAEEGSAGAGSILEELEGQGLKPRLLASRAPSADAGKKDVEALRGMVGGFRAKLEDHLKKALYSADGQLAAGVVPLEIASQERTPNIRDPLHRLVLKASPDSPVSGLYALALWDGKSLVDAQFNSVYFRPDEKADFRFLVASDLHGCDDEASRKAVMDFVLTANLRAGTGEEGGIEFVLLAGGLVDLGFTPGAEGLSEPRADYTRAYLQTWLALAGLRVPCYAVPGSADGFRIDGYPGARDGDGLRSFRATFGPPYFAFDRGPFRFLCLNSYDLPAPYRSLSDPGGLSRAGTSSSFFGLLNWGGGLQGNQFRWLVARLDELKRAPEGEQKRPVFVMHHDPRGSYPGWKARGFRPWDAERHFPVTASPKNRGPVTEQACRVEDSHRAAPAWPETEEFHAGCYTPLRARDADLTSEEWFERALPPEARGFPGWVRYQQEWHAPFEYVGRFRSAEPFAPARGAVVDPWELLTLIVDHRVPVLFKGHDRRFCRILIPEGETLLPGELDSYAEPSGRGKLERLRVKSPEGCTVYHVADVGSPDSDGHGYYLVTVEGEGMTVVPCQHPR